MKSQSWKNKKGWFFQKKSGKSLMKDTGALDALTVIVTNSDMIQKFKE